MIMRSKLKSVSLTLAGVALASFTSGCGDKVNVKEAQDDSLRAIVWEKNNLDVKLTAGEDSSLSISRVVVSKTTPRFFNQNEAGADTRITYAVEFWGRYINENGRADNAASVPRYGKIDGLFADKDGNLYVDGFEPGSQIDNPDLKTAAGQSQREIDRYEVSTVTPLITKFDWLIPSTDLVFSGTVSSTTVNFLNLGNLFSIGNVVGDAHKKVSALGNNAIFTFSDTTASGSNDTIYAKNDGYTKYVAPFACVIKANDDTTGNQSAILAAALTTAQGELGRKLLDPDGIIDNSDAAKSGVTGAQDLYTSWTVSYRLAGFNINTAKMNWYMTKSADFYQNRELPSVDQSSTAAAPSGIEKAIRECNDKATKNDTWTLVSRNPAVNSLTATNTHCEGMKSDTAKSQLSLAAFTSATPAYDCNAGFAGATAITTAGSWNGTAHTDRISSGDAASDLSDTTTSDIAEVQL